MHDTLNYVKLWLTFVGGVLIVAILYWAQAVLVPFALAILLTFVLTPPVNWLQRWVGSLRVPVPSDSHAGYRRRPESCILSTTDQLS